jgi:FkbM family methyltransferase
MKSFIKNVLQAVLGEANTAELIRRWRGQPLHFSEAEMIAEWFRANPRTGVIVDVGAHFGESFAPYLALGWEVLAFEPDPANRAKLRQNTATGAIKLYDCAVADREEEGVPFFASPESDGISGLSAFRETHREVNRVRLTTLAKVLGEAGTKRVDFLKIDTEGHDLFVLRGFPWDRLKPDVVLCEFEDTKTLPLGYDHRQMGDFLVAQGYQVFLSEWAPIIRYGTSHTWRSFRPYPCTLFDPKGWGNFVALRAGLAPTALHRYLRQFPAQQ